MSYFILLWRGFKSIKLKKCFFLPTFNKFSIQNNPLMQLLLIFHNANWKSQNFKVLSDLVLFQQLRKLWKEGKVKFILFWSLFLTIHINFQYKLKYHTILFIVTFYLFSSIALLISFSSAISLFFFFNFWF